MAYTSTERFIKFGSYLLMEYDYTSAPTPEIYYVNTGTPAIGFEKIVNGYFNNSDMNMWAFLLIICLSAGLTFIFDNESIRDIYSSLIIPILIDNW